MGGLGENADDGSGGGVRRGGDEGWEEEEEKELEEEEEEGVHVRVENCAARCVVYMCCGCVSLCAFGMCQNQNCESCS